MNWRKNLFSYILWFIYAVMVSAGVLGVTVLLCNTINFPIWSACLIAVGELAGAGAFVYASQRGCWKAGLYGWRKYSTAWKRIELVIILVLLLVGIGLRSKGLTEAAGAMETDVLYKAAKVEAGNVMPKVLHGATWLYLQFLHILLLLLGNKAAVAVGVQIILQLLAGLALGCSVRRLAGKLAGVITVAFWMLSPYMADKALELSPACLFLVLYVIAFGLIGIQLKRNRRNPAVIVLLGILAGIVSCLDLFGFTLFLLFAADFGVKREGREQLESKAGVFLGCGVFGGLLGFVGAIAGAALSCGREFMPMLRDWAESYQVKSFSLTTVLRAEGFYVDFVLLFAFLAVGIYTFWCHKDFERQGIWMGITFILTMLLGLQLLTANTGSTAYLYGFLAVLAGVAAELMLAEEKAPAKAAERAGTEKETAAEETFAAAEEEESVCEKMAAEEASRLQLLENPLPLPKKHEHKVMDYRLKEMEEDNYDFDVYVSDEDDFDVS